MLKKYKIYLDESNEIFADYLKFEGAKSFFLPHDNEIPLIDQILFQTDNEQKIILIITIPTLGKFLSRPSKHNGLANLVNQGKIKLIISNQIDSVYQLSFFYYQREKNVFYNPYKFLTGLNATILLDGYLDIKIKKMFPKTDFFDAFRYPFLDIQEFPEVFVPNEEASRQRSFFTCFLNDPKRPHRVSLSKKLSKTQFAGQPLIKCGPWSLRGNDNLATDIYECGYNKEWVDQVTFKKKHLLPNLKFYSESNMELVVEGLGFDDDISFDISEKIVRPFYMKLPFLVVSNKNFLSNLRTMGFKTFDGLIDESYDKLDMVEDRIEKIIEVLRQVDIRKARQIFHESKPIRDHNRDNFLKLKGGYKSHLWTNCRKLFKKFA